MLLRIIITLVLIVVTVAIAGRRVAFLVTLIRSGRPVLGRTEDLGIRLRAQVIEVFGQKKLLNGTSPAWPTS